MTLSSFVSFVLFFFFLHAEFVIKCLVINQDLNKSLGGMYG